MGVSTENTVFPVFSDGFPGDK